MSHSASDLDDAISAKGQTGGGLLCVNVVMKQLLVP